MDPRLFVLCLCWICAWAQETTTEQTTTEEILESTTTTTTELASTYSFETTTTATARKIADPQPPRANRTVVVYCDASWSSRDYLLEHPGFPHPYPNGALCRYTVRKNSARVCGLEITFRKFDLETSPGCHRDFLAIGDERLCGHIPAKSVVQYPFDPDSDSLALVFGSNDNVTRSGFQILFQQITVCEDDLNAIPAIHACDVLITDPSGELVTHRSPSDALGDPVCRYTIGRRHSGYCHVELDFVDFNVEYSPGCIDSYVQLDGHRFCGTSLRGQRKNVTFDTLGNVHVVYKTDTVRLDKGFHLLFRQLVCPPGNPVRSPGGTDLVNERLPSACSKIYYEKEFYVESPGFPNYYANDLDCHLVVRRYRPSICKMDVRFLDFDVEESPGCVFDFLQLDSQRLCGRIPEDNVRSVDFLSYEKVLRFKTDSVNPRPGFFLYVRQLDCGSAGAPIQPSVGAGGGPGCDVHVWEYEARVSSPQYPRDYANDLLCKYTVHRQGSHICHLRLTFLDFKLQEGSPGCYSDYLELDGGWRACGDKFQGITRTLDFRTSEKVLVFRSDSWYTERGFLLSLRQVPCSEGTSGRLDAPSCDREFEAASFHIRSELYPLNYSPSLDCRYVIRKVSPSVCQLKIRFTHFDLEISSGCNRDYLALDNQKLCGSLPINTTRNLRFDSPEKVLLFHSNSDIQAPGFSATVQQVECPGGFPPPDDAPPSTPSVQPSTSPSGGGSCSRVFSELRSTFSSPHYPSPYPVGVSCRYVFRLQPGFCSVEFSFVEFLLEPGLPCTRDYLEMAGVRYCGQQFRGATKLEYPASGTNEIVVTFLSDAVITDKGFLASFRQVSCGPPPPPQPPRGSDVGSSCGGQLTGPSFEIRWPEVVPDYGQSVQCAYTVHRLGSDTCTLRVTFVTFDLGDCPRQFVQIGEHTLCGRLPAYTVRDYNLHDYTTTIRATSSQVPRPRLLLQLQQLPCGAVGGPPVRAPPPACDETFAGPAFELRSPLYPHGLSSNVDCRYIVRKSSPFACHLELTFERFELPDTRHCHASHLRIDADRLCGSITPYSVRLYDFTTSEKLIHFSADHVLPGAGFVIKGRQVPCGGVPPSALMPSSPEQGRSPIPADSPAPSSRRCDQSYGLEEFTVTSPDHPSYYPSDAYCRFVVIRSSPEVCGLEVTFVTFDLEDYYQCHRDYLDIDGERLCGILPPQSLRSYVFHPADRTKVMVFRSDHANSRPGFVLRVRQTRICPASVPSLLPASPSGPGSAPSGGGESSVCETSYFSSPRGSFRSPRFPSGYPATHCLYTFVQLRGFCSLRLYFRDFDLLPAAECIVDYFELEGRRHCDRQLYQLAREVFFPWSDSSTISAMFHSDRGSFVHRGYHVDFEQVPCRRQGRNQREELELAVTPHNATAYTSSATDEDWDDTKTTPKNSTVEYSA